MHLHAVTKGLFFTAADIADWVIENNYDPADWEAAPDLLEAFGNRPSIEITEAVTICADVLCGNGVLLVDCVQHTTGALVNVYQVQFEAYDVLFDIYPKLADALDLVVLQVMESAE